MILDSMNRHLIYQNELEAKDTTDTQKSVSYLVLHFEIDNGARLKQNKRDDFTFPIVNFLFSSSNIPTAQFDISYGNLVLVIQCSYFLKEFNYIRKDY